jgi:hypothetical protein
MTDKKPPLHTVRIGNIKASIWENQSNTGKNFYTTTMARSYRDEHDQWHESVMFFTDDLPKIELATKKAFEFIYMRAAERKQPTQEQAGTEEIHKKDAGPSQQEEQLGLGDGEENGTHVKKLASNRSSQKR